jgi:hypothetical protein
MPYNLLLLPLVGGYLFLHLAHLFRFSAQRMDGYRLLFQAAVAGLLLSAAGRMTELLVELTPLGPFLKHYWLLFSPFPYSAVSALSLILGPLFALILNLFIPIEKAKSLEIESNGNLFLSLLDQAVTESKLISVTLDSRKWYIGWVVQSPSLYPHEQYFRLLPLISGYRDKDTLETRRIVYYEAVLKDKTLDPNEFVITLPLKDVKIAGFFNDEVYDEYFTPPPPEPVMPIVVN